MAILSEERGDKRRADIEEDSSNENPMMPNPNTDGSSN
jgi:hypothetical protein